MSLVKVGTNYRVVYESKDLKSGIDNIFSIIKRPDGVKVGPTQLSEELIAELAGTYSVEILIPTNAPIGEWSGVVYSMDEGFKSAFRFSVTDGLGGGVSSSDCEEEVDLIIDQSFAALNIEDEDDLNLIIDSSEVSLSVYDDEIGLVVTSEEVNLTIDDVSIDLDVNCEEL